MTALTPSFHFDAKFQYHHEKQYIYKHVKMKVQFRFEIEPSFCARLSAIVEPKVEECFVPWSLSPHNSGGNRLTDVEDKGR